MSKTNAKPNTVKPSSTVLPASPAAAPQSVTKQKPAAPVVAPAKPAVSAYVGTSAAAKPIVVEQPGPVQSNVLGAQLPQSLVAVDPKLGFVAVQQPTAEAMKGAVAMDFKEGEGQPSVKLKAGGKFLLTYAPERSPVKATVHGMPAYGVDAYVRFEPSGKVVRQAAVAFEQTQNRTLEKAYAAPILVDIPADTTKVSVWFKQFSGGDTPPDVRWDSNLDGQNYNYTLE